ncbi:MAG: molybdate ABC transporter substrate-binding protein [Burkholderiales bacterium]|nr:molybdate ABC transporter substrate-binding protein [Burkholderiales bacterium]MDE1928055.1 molybdate ABC transporter substrate-binding protein [Burkholderiales bacterium]MDE2158775.1 molybdate ABC transporter substrate-binding protein [Burkholderiales bacterium]MDE2503604.1 molybdate ABC transporter substrate-binding protein [Burkholderiales bacterium]
MSRLLAPLLAPLLATLTLLSPLAARADVVQIAVAANFAKPMAQIAEGFTAATGHQVRISVGATGTLYAQIVAGAPFDILLSADEATPRKLVKQGLGVAGTQFTYAIGKLALYSAKPGFVDQQGAVLAGGAFDHLALADAKVAPYGAAALQVLAARGLLDRLKPKIVTAESIGQAYQFTASGNAELGFVALSQLLVPGTTMTGSLWTVPQALYTPLRQDAVLLQPGKDKAAAQALMLWLHQEPTKTVLEIYGYGHAD